MDEGEKRSKLFDADESAMEEMSPDFSSDAEPDVYKDGSAYDPMWGNVLNKKSDYGDENEGRGRRVFGGKAQKVKDNKGDKKKNAADALKKNEEKASKNPNDDGRGGDKNASLGEKEDNVESDSQAGKFKNAVQGVEQLKKGDIKGGSSKLKKAGPLMAVLALLLGFGGASFFGQMSMPFSLISQFQEEFDSIRTSQNLRSKNWLKIQLDNGNIKDCRISIFGKQKFKPSKRMIRKLGVHGITFEDIDGVKVMKFKGETIVPDQRMAGDGKIAFDEAFNNNQEFRTAYSKGAATWRGAVGAWFDTSMEKLLNKLGVKRGVWNNYKNGTDTEENSKFKETIADEADSDGVKANEHGHESEKTTEVDDSGNATTEKTITPTDTEDVDLSRTSTGVEADGKGKVRNTDGVKAKLSSIGQVVTKVSSVASGVVNIYCGVADFVAAVNGIVAAYQAAQIIKTTAAIFEGIQKAQAGDADASPIHEIANSLTTPTYNTYDMTAGVDENGESTGTNSVERYRSAMEANAIGATYGGTLADGKDLSVATFNMNSTTKKLYSGVASIMNNVSVSATSFASCSAARLAAAGVGMATDIIGIVGCIASWGIGCAVDAIYEAIGQTAATAAFSVAVSAAVSFLVPHVAKVLTRTIATEVMGEDLGNALVDGANMYMGHNHQNSGGSVASVNSLSSFLISKSIVNEEEARFERETHSPFDVTSKYTFMGSLASQMVPLASQASSFSGLVRGASTVFGKALSSLIPHSSAVSAGIEAEERYQDTKRNCPDLAGIGGVGDVFCNPYIITDTRTIDSHPADIVDSLANAGDIEIENDKISIKEDSKLAQYIIYCGQRQSPWGIADQNIMNEVELGTTGNQYGDAIIGAIPVVGDFTDIVSSASKLANLGWITGQSCVTNPPEDIDFVNKYSAEYGAQAAITWDKGKTYQRFIEDQRLAEIEYGSEYGESAVSEFLANYYEKHPLDNSFEGVLARYSGYTKEQVAYTLDLLELGQFVADYNPTSLYPYSQSEDNELKLEIIENNRIEELFIATIHTSKTIIARREALIA